MLFAVHLRWPQHLQCSRTLALAADEQRGMALALMGVGLLMAVRDLLDQSTAGDDEQRAQDLQQG